MNTAQNTIKLTPCEIDKMKNIKEHTGKPSWSVTFTLRHEFEATFFEAAGRYFGLITVTLDRVPSIYGGHEWSVSAKDILRGSIETDYHKEGEVAVHIGTRKTCKEAKALALAAIAGDWMLQNRRHGKLAAPSFKAENEAYEAAFEATFFGE